jgi:predicted dehydrogenase
MFIAGSTTIADAAFNDVWTIRGEEQMPAAWKREDAALFAGDPMGHFHLEQVADFLRAVIAGRPPLVTAADGRRTVELFTAIYRATRDSRPVRFPVPVE